MKMLLKVGGAIIILLIVVLLILRVTGFGPNGQRAGLWLQGHLVTTPVTDWSFTDKYQTLELQTNTWYLIPHSVTIFCTSYQGKLYVSAIVSPGTPPYPHSRQWNENVARDPHVRLKIGDQVYDRTLTYITDPTEKAGVIQAEKKKYSDYHWTPSQTFNIFRVDDN